MRCWFLLALGFKKKTEEVKVLDRNTVSKKGLKEMFHMNEEEIKLP